MTLKITAPIQYPAGVAVTAYLTMTNTSVNNARNLSYTVPAPNTAGNTTGVPITVFANGANQHCENIDAGKSCVFTASIPADSVPGSFTVTATSNVEAINHSLQLNKKLQATNSLSITANLGLVNLPNVSNNYIIYLIVKQLIELLAVVLQ